MIGRWIVGVALLFGILLLMLPKTDEESLARIASTSMLMCTSEWREQVAQQVLREEAVEVTFRNRCPDLIASLNLNDDGEMVIAGNKYPVKMTLTPVVENGKVRWSCQGEPAGLVTKLCKP